MGASMRYLSQRFTAPNRICMGVLNDIGTEELAHLEMVATIVHQLTCNLTLEEIERAGFAPYYIDHTVGIWPQASGGVPFNANQFQSKGDPITDLHENLAAEQKARTVYDNILRMVKDPEVADPIRFLRAREIVHYQRFGEALRSLQEELDANNFYAFNPSFDAPIPCKSTPISPAVAATPSRLQIPGNNSNMNTGTANNMAGNRPSSRTNGRGNNRNSRRSM